MPRLLAFRSPIYRDSAHGLLKGPVPMWSELPDERTWKRLVAAASPFVDCIAGKLGRALIGILKKLEPALLGAIEPEHDALAEFGRLILNAGALPAA
jgi:hypothetical protein